MFTVYKLQTSLVLFLLFFICNASPAAKHNHAVNQERVEDGRYTARDTGHLTDDGEHHSEFDHEAILGSVKEAEEFDNLSPEESKRRLGILLTKMDLNNDKQIERNELHAWILRSFRMLSEEEAKERFEDCDENKDAAVTWKEYISDSYGIDGDDISVEEGEDQLIADDKVMFAAADENKDEVLSYEEFIVFSHPEEHPTMLPIILQQTLRDKDKNKDGFIDFQEFVGEQGKEHDKEWLVSEKEKFDSDHDKDHDGKLNNAEILSWVVPSNDEIAEEEVNHLFWFFQTMTTMTCCRFEEVLEHYDTFVGSEATDYGDQLNKISHFDDEL